MVKVIYTDKTVRYVSNSTLEKLIARNEISAYCGLDGWMSVEKKSLLPGSARQERPEMGRYEDIIEEGAICEVKRNKDQEDRKCIWYSGHPGCWDE